MLFFGIGVCRVGELCKVGDELDFGSYTSIIATESIICIANIYINADKLKLCLY